MDKKYVEINFSQIKESLKRSTNQKNTPPSNQHQNSSSTISNNNYYSPKIKINK